MHGNTDIDPTPAQAVIQTGFNYSQDWHRGPLGLHHYTCRWSAFILLEHHMDKVDCIFIFVSIKCWEGWFSPFYILAVRYDQTLW